MMKYTLALVTLLLSNNVFAEAVFEGTYKCTGSDPYLNKKYAGTMVIKQQNAVYSMKMKYDTGEELHGTGGQYNSQLLSVVFQDPRHLKKVGLEQYQWADDEHTRMGGYWVYLGQDKLGSEICEKQNTSSG